ncbi:MAG: pectate lyase, partial [Vicinamibacteraceae bacterium]|nr:pectate lyase [Vicinamibacteraceae bacterium]
MVRLRTLSLVPHLVALLVAAAVPAATTVQPAPEARGVRAGAPQAQERAASPPRSTPGRQQILDTMKRATRFMVEKISTRGGYVWTYLPDLSRRWGELEARDTQIWMQPPGTATMGHLFLDAYHATGDEYYYDAAEQVAGAVIWGQHPSGGWNYVVDFAGDRSLRDWYATIGRNAWRLEEFQYYYGNATFDDGGTAEAARLLLRMYLEKLDPKYKPALDRAIRFILDSQYPLGTWPQRYPLRHDFSHHGLPDYTSYPTFNDDVAAENIEFLIQCYQTLGDPSLLDPIRRGMHAFVATQLGPPQPGWALQFDHELKPAAARTYEPRALATHTTAQNIGILVRFYRLTGDTKFLARIPEALDWLEAVKLPPSLATPQRTHPTFIEVGTNDALYVHREGSNVVNGRYFADKDPEKTLGHYSSFRRLDLAALRRLYDEARATPPSEAVKGSPLAAGPGTMPLPKYFTVPDAAAVGPARRGPAPAERAAELIASLRADGSWLSPLGTNSHPYSGPSPKEVAPGDFAQTLVGDDTDTSPFRDETLVGISTPAFIRNMGAL